MSESVVGVVLSWGWESAVSVSSGQSCLVGGLLETGDDLVNGPVWVLSTDKGGSSSHMGASHGGSGHGDVVVGTGSSRDDVLSGGRDFGLQESRGRRSSGREGGHNIIGEGGSNGKRAWLISGRVGSSASGSTVSNSENWDDVSVSPGSDLLVVPGLSCTTSPAVADNGWPGVSGDHELGA